MYLICTVYLKCFVQFEKYKRKKKFLKKTDEYSETCKKVFLHNESAVLKIIVNQVLAGSIE